MTVLIRTEEADTGESALILIEDGESPRQGSPELHDQPEGRHCWVMEELRSLYERTPRWFQDALKPALLFGLVAAVVITIVELQRDRGGDDYEVDGADDEVEPLLAAEEEEASYQHLPQDEPTHRQGDKLSFVKPEPPSPQQPMPTHSLGTAVSCGGCAGTQHSG